MPQQLRKRYRPLAIVPLATVWMSAAVAGVLPPHEVQRAEYIVENGRLSATGDKAPVNIYDGPAFPSPSQLATSDSFVYLLDGKVYTQQVTVDSAVRMDDLVNRAPLVYADVHYASSSPSGSVDAGAYYGTSEVKYFATLISKPGAQAPAGGVPVAVRGRGLNSVDGQPGSNSDLFAESVAWAATPLDGLQSLGYASANKSRPQTSFDHTVVFHMNPDVDEITVDIWARVVADGRGFEQGPVSWLAQASADPVLTIDPAYAADYTLVYSSNLPAPPVPEPATAVLFGTGLVAMWRRLRR